MLLLTVLVGAATLCALAERLGWPFELFAHFRPHIQWSSVIFAMLALAMGKFMLLPVLAGVPLLLAATNRPLMFIKPSPVPGDDPGIGVVWANVWGRRQTAASTLEYAIAKGAEIVLFGEFNGLESKHFPLLMDFPYQLDLPPQPNTKGPRSRLIAYSRLPIEGGRTIVEPANGERPIVSFRVRLPRGRPLQIIAAHPHAPGTPRMLRQRNAGFDRIHGLASPPFLVAGDFNATPWSNAYRRLPGLRIGDPRQEYTWITRLPLLGLPIDHFKVSPGVAVSAYEVAPFLGSDQRALFARIHVSGSASDAGWVSPREIEKA